jgi:hypothetical protein
MIRLRLVKNVLVIIVGFIIASRNIGPDRGAARGDHGEDGINGSGAGRQGSRPSNCGACAPRQERFVLSRFSVCDIWLVPRVADQAAPVSGQLSARPFIPGHPGISMEMGVFGCGRRVYGC